MSAKPCFRNYSERLQQVTSLKALDACLTQALKAFGFSMFAYTFYGNDFASKVKLHHQYATSNLSDWHRYFHECEYEHVDVIGKQVRQSELPLLWDLNNYEMKGLGKQLQRDANARGLQCGLSIPIFGPHQSFAILVIQANDIKERVQADADLPSELQRYAIYYQHYLRQLLLNAIETQESVELSKRELQCLRLVAENYDNKQVAEQLGIQPRTVNFHFENINKKLGTKNRFSAVRMAQVKGLL
tara:strand:- start:56725 stop:57456 length:732 start_codon:yes stop_codon:yes gene_type:complete